jgi:hypothetical protein
LRVSILDTGCWEQSLRIYSRKHPERGRPVHFFSPRLRLFSVEVSSGYKQVSGISSSFIDRTRIAQMRRIYADCSFRFGRIGVLPDLYPRTSAKSASSAFYKIYSKTYLCFAQSHPVWYLMQEGGDVKWLRRST